MSFVLCEKNTFVDELFTSDIDMRCVKSEPTLRSHPTTRSQELTDYILAFADRAACLKNSYVDHASPRSSNALLIHEKRPRPAMQTLETCDTMPIMSKEQMPLLTMDAMEPFPDTDDEFADECRITIRGGSRVGPIDTSASLPEIDDLCHYDCTSGWSITAKRLVPTRGTIESLPETDGEFGYNSKSQMTNWAGRHVLPLDTNESLPETDDLLEYDRASQLSRKALRLVPQRMTMKSVQEVDDYFEYDSKSQMAMRGARHVSPKDTSASWPETDYLFDSGRASQSSTTAWSVPKGKTMESLIEVNEFWHNNKRGEATKDSKHLLTGLTMDSLLHSETKFGSGVDNLDPLPDSWSPRSSLAPASQSLRTESRTGIEENDTAFEVAATTLMICNLPCKLSQEDLLRHVDELGFAGTYDLIYLPLGKGSAQFLGYGFINFCTPEYAQRFASAFESYRFHTENTVRHAVVKVAKAQGLQNMLASIEKSTNFRKRSHAPLLFSPSRSA